MKNKYNVCNYAEGEIHGEIFLTPEEAAIVEYATNPDNWINRGGDGYGGSFHITDATLDAIVDACDWEDWESPFMLCADCKAREICPAIL